MSAALLTAARPRCFAEDAARWRCLCGELAHDLGNDWSVSDSSSPASGSWGRTVESDNAEDENDGQRHDDDRVDLEPRRLIGVEL